MSSTGCSKQQALQVTEQACRGELQRMQGDLAAAQAQHTEGCKIQSALQQKVLTWWYCQLLLPGSALFLAPCTSA